MSEKKTTLLLRSEDIVGLMSMSEAISISENTFKQKALGKIQMPHKTYLRFGSYDGDMRVMPAFLEDPDIAGVKIVSVNPNNPRDYGLPTVIATIVLVETTTGWPLCVMEGTWLTALRTGAAGGVAAKILSREDSHIVGLVGAGIQARTQLLAINCVRNITLTKVVDISKEAMRKFVDEMSKQVDFDIIPVDSVHNATVDSDIVVTATPAKNVLVTKSDIQPGTHINAIGADAPGKQELDTQILKSGKVIVDDYEQAITAGEINKAIKESVITRQNIYGELGEILLGVKKGRESKDEITIFDSTGIAIQDIASAWVLYLKAKKLHKGFEIKLF